MDIQEIAGIATSFVKPEPTVAQCQAFIEFESVHGHVYTAYKIACVCMCRVCVDVCCVCVCVLYICVCVCC